MAHVPLVQGTVEGYDDVQRSRPSFAPRSPALLRERGCPGRQAQVQGRVEGEVDPQLEGVCGRDAQDSPGRQGLLDGAAGSRVVARSVGRDAGGERREEGGRDGVSKKKKSKIKSLSHLSLSFSLKLSRRLLLAAGLRAALAAGAFFAAAGSGREGEGGREGKRWG